MTIPRDRQMLTVQQAADFLNVSRPFLVALLKKGDIDCITDGDQDRIDAGQLIAYKRIRDGRRAEALSRLAEADVEHL